MLQLDNDCSYSSTSCNNQSLYTLLRQYLDNFATLLQVAIMKIQPEIPHTLDIKVEVMLVEVTVVVKIVV